MKNNINEIKRLKKLAGLTENIEDYPGFNEWPNAIYNFIYTNLSSEDRELPSVIDALKIVLDKFEKKMGSYDPDYHYPSQISKSE